MATTKHVESKSLQLWPGGASLTYRGDPNGPADQKRLRTGYRHEDKPRWRKGTADEWRQIRIEERAEMYRDRDVLACQSSLVDDLIKQAYESRGDLAEGFQPEEIRNLRPDPSDWDEDQCREWLADHTSDDTAGLDLDGLQDAVRDNVEDAEVYEWWLVSSWLCDKLHEIGEVTIDNGYGHWWGRQATGQQMIMDGTLQRIAAQFEEMN